MENGWRNQTPPVPAVAGSGSSARTRRLFQSMRAEVRQRAPLYADDWLVGLNHPLKVLSSSLFMFFVSVFPALTFGNELAHRTSLNYGIIEVLLSTSVSGVVFATFSGQPLVIMGVTGPITAFSTSMYRISQALGFDFLSLMFWTCLWAGVMHFALAALNCCDDLVRYVTRFSCEVFGVLIAVIYIFSGIEGVVRRYEGSDSEHMSIFLLVTLNTLVVTALSLQLGSAQSWWIFSPRVRFYIADWGVSTSVVFTWVIISCTPPWKYVRTRNLPIPKTLAPSHPRPWLVRPLDAPPAAIAFALLPALILTTLLFFDHNVSSLLSQSPALHLKKPPAFNYDFFIVGLSVIACGALGLPPAHGLIPQAILHVESLVQEKHAPRNRPPNAAHPRYCSTSAWANWWQQWMASTDALPEHHNPGSPEQPPAAPPSPPAPETYVVETRLSGLLQSIAIGCTLAPPTLSLIRAMPPSLLYGTFLYMGVASFANNQFSSRLLALTLTQPAHRPARYMSAHLPPSVLSIPPCRILQFTLLQLLCLIVVVGITIWGGPASICFPLLILLLVPLRHRLFPKFFTAQELEILDSWAPPPPKDEPTPAVAPSLEDPAPHPPIPTHAPR